MSVAIPTGSGHVVSLSILIVASSFNGLAQVPQSRTIDLTKLHDQLLEVLFPWERKGETSAKTKIVVRFHPSFSSESQFCLKFDEQTTAEYLRAKVALERILQDARHSLQVTAIVKSVGIQQATRNVAPDRATRWLDEFWTALAASAPSMKASAGMVQLDGTKYELRVWSGETYLTLTIYDDEAGNEINGEAPIVQWMNAVRIHLNKDAGFEDAKVVRGQ